MPEVVNDELMIFIKKQYDVTAYKDWRQHSVIANGRDVQQMTSIYLLL